MKVATRLALAFGLMATFLVGLLVYHVRTIGAAAATNYELSEISARIALGSGRLPAHLARLDETASKYWITRDSGYLRQFDEAAQAFDDGVRRLGAYAVGDAEREAIDQLASLWAEFAPAAEALRPSPGGPAQRLGQAPLVRIAEHLDRLRAQTRLVAFAAQEQMDERLERSAAAARHAARITWGTVVGALLLGILVSGLVVRSISDALRRLQEGTRQVAGGNFEYRLDEGRSDEFAELARDFNTMTRRLGELDRMKRDFLSKVSHDLKTPLASMQETTRLLLDEIPGPLTAGQERLLRLNLESGQRLSSMIGKLLDLSAIEAGTLGLEIGRYGVDTLVHKAIAATAAASIERNVRIATRIPDPKPEIMCDGDLVVQLLVNLLENAVKFSPPGAKVEVAARVLTARPHGVPEQHWAALESRSAGRAGPTQRGAALLMAVTDSGPGIPEAEAASIFERFYQTPAGRRVERRGVGLGLAICREIVDAHGGAIWVSPAADGGSTFSVLLPGAIAEPTHAPVRTVTAT